MLCITIMEHIGIFERMSWIIRTQDITITNRVIQKAAITMKYDNGNSKETGYHSVPEEKRR